MDWKLELVILPVSDVDRAKRFYAEELNFTVDVDHSAGDFRIVQLTPPGSACSVTLMRNEEAAGSVQGVHLVVADLEAARGELVARGVAGISEPFHFGSGGQEPGLHPARDDFASFFSVTDPDGNGFLVQEVPSRAGAGDREGIVAAFLAGARAVAEAIGSDVVGARWDAASVLDEQTVGGLVGHLARSGIFVVDDYLRGDDPTGDITFESAGAYYARAADRLTVDDHAAIRQRGADVAADGHDAVTAQVRDRVAQLEAARRTLDPSRRIAVAGGAVMCLGDYLETRIVEQVVHLDDLARSVGAESWPLPRACTDIALAVATDLAARRSGTAAIVRAMYRRGFADAVLPVL